MKSDSTSRKSKASWSTYGNSPNWTKKRMRRSSIRQASDQHAKRLRYLRRPSLIIHPRTREPLFTANNRICWAWSRPCTLTAWVLHRAREGCMATIMTHPDYQSWRHWEGQLSLLLRKRLYSRSIHSHGTGSSCHKVRLTCSITQTALPSLRLPKIESLVTPWYTQVKSIT